MINLTNFANAPRVPFDLDGRIMFTNTKVELVHLTLPPGKMVPPHSNPFDVVFYQLEGELVLNVEEEAILLTPNCAVHVDSGKNRALTNKSESIARVIVVKIF